MLRQSILAVSCVFLLSLVLGSAASAADPDLIGWWKFDEGVGTIAYDSSGLGNDGKFGPEGTPKWVAGKFGGGISLDGNDDYIEINAVANDMPANNNFTISAWVKTTTGDGNVIGSNDSGSGHDFIFGLASNGQLLIEADSVRNYPPVLNDGQWHMITYVRNGTTAYLYTDGVQVGTETPTGNPATQVRWSIGQEWDSSPSDEYEGAVDDVRFYKRALTVEEIKAIMKGESYKAEGANPANSATDVPRDAILGWTAGEFAKTHDVYFGTVFADVNTASRTSAKGVLAGQGQAETTFDPAGLFAYGQTYYWRIDEVNAPPSSTIFKGETWSFTAEPYGYPVKPVKATASSEQPSMGPEKTIDGSGLTRDLHGVEPSTMWLSLGVQPNWIQYEFDTVYKFHELLVWNSNQMIEAFMGFGAKTVTIETSTDGTTWTALANVPEFSKAPGAAGYAAGTTVSLGGIEAKFVKLTIVGTWGGLAPQAGLAEVRFSYVPVQARAPQPATGATTVSVDTDLNWRPGREADSHKVFFGTDPNAVRDGTAPAKTVTDHSFTPGSLNLATSYYWKADEVGAATYAGDVWSFTTEDYRVVEDFESYTDDEGSRIYETWIDGWTNNTGAVVGNLTSPFAEQTIVHGGKQSMPLAYDNTKAPSYSEAVRTFESPQNWTTNGVKSLSLWFRGVAGNGGQLYVKINSTKIAYDGDAADLARGAWRVWNIDLSKAGNVSSVRSLTIGLEGSGAKGTLYFDDIRLYSKTPEYVTPVQPAATSLVAHYTFDEGSGTTVKDSSGKGNNGTFGPEGTPRWVAGKFGGGLELDGNDDYVNIDALANDIPADNNFTVSAWIKTTIANATRLVVASNNSTGGHDFELGLASGGNLLVQANTAHNYPPQLNDDQWHMITYVRDGTSAYLYTDGVLVGTETPSGDPAGQVRWSIGQEWDPPSPSDEYQGTVDDVRIYARPLSAGEVAGLAGLTKPMHKAF